MLYIQNFNVKEGRAVEMQTWVKKNEDAIAKSAPKGWKYRGTYSYVLGFGNYAGMVMWECGRYGDFDTWREHDDPGWVRLNMEFIEFLTEEVTPAVLCREIGDTRMFEPKKKTK